MNPVHSIEPTDGESVRDLARRLISLYSSTTFTDEAKNLTGDVVAQHMVHNLENIIRVFDANLCSIRDSYYDVANTLDDATDKISWLSSSTNC